MGKYLRQHVRPLRIMASVLECKHKDGGGEGDSWITTYNEEHFNISMASDEDGPSTAFTSTRADWRKLPFFYVTVEYYK